jgi:hypothetical protein
MTKPVEITLLTACYPYHSFKAPMADNILIGYDSKIDDDGNDLTACLPYHILQGA